MQINTNVMAVPTDGYHAGRLAVEQMYGYMVRNAKKYGVLTTTNAWVFFMRANGGRLWMTRPIDCASADPPFTILQLLYWMSALTARDGHLVETDKNGNPVMIDPANSKYPWPAPSVTGGGGTQSHSDTFSHPTYTSSLGPIPQFHLVPRDVGHR